MIKNKSIMLIKLKVLYLLNINLNISEIHLITNNQSKKVSSMTKTSTYKAKNLARQ
jgi:hypothetical protein